jgi:peroxiredoxin
MVIRNLVAATALILAAGSPAMAVPAVGEKVTDTRFTTAYGQTLSLADLKGEVVVLTYWMSDCQPCQEQLRTLDFYYRQRQNVGLRVLAFAPEEITSRQLKHAFRDKLIHPLSSISGPFGPKDTFPTTYIIDRYGQVRYADSGAIGIEQLNELLVPLLKQPQP